MSTSGEFDAGDGLDRDFAAAGEWCDIAAVRRRRADRDRGVVDAFEHAGQGKARAEAGNGRVNRAASAKQGIQVGDRHEREILGALLPTL